MQHERDEAADQRGDQKLVSSAIPSTIASSGLPVEHVGHQAGGEPERDPVSTRDRELLEQDSARVGHA